MNSTAQAGMEYLVNFGWALVLVLSIIGALFFLPSEPISFSSSVPEKLTVSEALFSSQILALKLHNPSDQSLELVALGLHGSFEGALCSVENLLLSPVEAFSFEIGAGGEVILQCDNIPDLDGELSLAYNDPTCDAPLIIILSPTDSG